jgi:hypothetical protein
MRLIIVILLLLAPGTIGEYQPVQPVEAAGYCFRGTLTSSPPDTIYYTTSGKICTYPSARARCNEWR